MTSENVTTSEEVEKGTKKLDDMKEAVVTIRRKYLDNFEGQSKGSTGWFNIDNVSLKIKFSTLEPNIYKKLYERILKVKILNHIKSL